MDLLRAVAILMKVLEWMKKKLVPTRSIETNDIKRSKMKIVRDNHFMTKLRA